MKKFVKFDFISYEEAKNFNRNIQNRVINKKHVDEIKKLCLELGMDTMPPIRINTLTMNIVDGQHRSIAFQELIEEGKIPVDTKIKGEYFLISVDEELDTIVKMNKNQKGWNLDDYVESEMAGGNEIYIRFDEWCRNHTLSSDNGKPKYRYGASIILGVGCQKKLQDRVFEFSDNDERKGEKVHSEMIEILKILEFPMKGCWIESMAIAWHAIRDMHDFKLWIRELKKQKPKLCKLPHESKGDWMNNIFSPVHLALDKKRISH